MLWLCRWEASERERERVSRAIFLYVVLQLEQDYPSYLGEIL